MEESRSYVGEPGENSCAPQSLRDQDLLQLRAGGAVHGEEDPSKMAARPLARAEPSWLPLSPLGPTPLMSPPQSWREGLPAYGLLFLLRS